VLLWVDMLRKLFRRKRIKMSDIAPDEIFLDSSNLPHFNRGQFEGRFEKPLPGYVFYIVLFAFIIIAGVFIGRLWFLQIVHGEEYANASENNRLDHALIFSERGVIYDRTGEKLAWNVPNEAEPNTYALRAYTDLTGMGHILGHVQYPAKDTSGKYYTEEYVGGSGVEAIFNEVLSGENGVRIVETDAHGDIISENSIRRPKAGNNVILSIDAGLEHELYDAISSFATLHGFKGGAGVIMDVTTGELLALTSYPEVEPAVLTNGDSVSIGAYHLQSNTPFLNRVIGGQYTPGSIVKPFVAIGSLNEGIVDPEKKFLSTGSISVPNPYDPDNPSIFADWKAHGYVNMYDALAVSSNVYFYYVGGGFNGQEGLGIERLDMYFDLFGFGKTTNILLAGEEDGIVPSPQWKAENFEDDVWRIGDTYHTAIGQYGFLVTPLQVVRAISAIANDGLLLEPKLLFNDTVNIDTRIDIPEEDFSIVRKGMREGVLRGTAQALNVSYVNAAGKTGTAELGSKKKSVNSWTIGFFPYEKPRYAFAVIMESGPSSNLVGATAVMRQVFNWIDENRPEYFVP